MQAIGQVGPNTLTMTNATPANSTNTTTGASTSVDVVGTKTVSLFFQASSGSSTNGTVVTFPVKVSPDDSTFYTPSASGYRFALTMTGTSTNTAFGTIDMTGARYFKVLPPENPSGAGAASNYVTNIVVKYFYK